MKFELKPLRLLNEFWHGQEKIGQETKALGIENGPQEEASLAWRQGLARQGLASNLDLAPALTIRLAGSAGGGHL
jgi:hypothetical protein